METKWRLTTAERLGSPPKLWQLRYIESYGNGGGFAGGSRLEWSASATLRYSAIK